MGLPRAKWGVAYTLEVPVPKRGVVDFALSADWTPATGDSKVSKDGGNVANTTNLPAILGGTGAAVWQQTLTAAEMQCASRVLVQWVDSATKAIEDQAYVIEIDYGIRSNTAQGGAASTITLDASASSTDDFYAGEFIEIISGAGAGQVRRIASYVGSTKVATVGSAWATNPDNTSIFRIGFLTSGNVNLTHWKGTVPADYSTTRGTSGTALPNAAADAAGGLPISDAGGLDLDAQLGKLDAKISDVPAAVRDVDNTTPAEGSLGAVLNAILSIFNGMTSLANWLRRMIRKDVGTANMGVAESEIGTGGAGVTYSGTTDNLEAIKDAGGGGGGGGDCPNETEVAAEVVAQLSAANLNPQNVISPFPRGGTVDTLQNTAYKSALGNRKRWVDVNGTWPVLTGADIEIRIDQGTGDRLDFAGVVITATGDSKSVGLDLEEADTLSIAESEETAWRYWVITTIDGDELELAYGRWISRTQAAEPSP